MSPLILVVDDDPAIVHLLKENLEGQGYRVVVGYDGEMALQVASASPPQLIIMDLNMPGVGVLEALAVLRRNAMTSVIPVLFLTGNDLGQVPREALNQPRVSHLTKPIELDQLNAVVQKMLANSPVA